MQTNRHDFGGKILWKWFLNKVQAEFFDVIPTKRRQGPQYGLLGLWGPGGIIFSSLPNESPILYQNVYSSTIIVSYIDTFISKLVVS